MKGNILSVFRRALVVAAALLGLGAQPPAEECYYAVEMNGVLCGYARLVTSPLREGARTVTLLTHEIVVKGTLLGGAVDNRILLTYHLDPVTKAFTYHESALEQGPSRLTSAIRVEGRTARVSDGAGGKETVVDLPADVVLDNALFHPHLVADFIARKAEQQIYRLFDGRDSAVRQMTYTKKGTETLKLAGQAFDTIVLDAVDRRTGANTTLWLDPRTGIAVQTRNPGNQRIYLADPTIVETVNGSVSRPDLSPMFMWKANVTISNVRGISHMKVRATAQPSGLRLTPDALNLPGQHFTGTVKDNLVDGVFEIEHRRYDGVKAQPFPPDFSKDPALREDLQAGGYIQSDDPVLAEKAREITAGARDSWEAVRRSSVWVSKNIKGAIPGGVTARGTYDQRAGECGGHSFLMAAFSRSVGIPARAVWGCLYTPHDGGAFGQHAWNEVYMGEAGWIPLDTTISETDYVDSGHIRVGVHQSVATTLNVRAIEILEHRVSPAPGSSGSVSAPPAVATAPQAAAGAAKFEAYLGEYTNPGRGTVKVTEQGGRLTLDIAGKGVLSLKEPDAEGAWRSTISDQMYAVFERNDGGPATALQVHQELRLRKTGSPPEAAEDAPADLRAYPGTYLLAQAQAEFILAYETQGLALYDPLSKRTIPLKPSGKPGTWTDGGGGIKTRFERNEAGGVAAMLLDGATIFRR